MKKILTLILASGLLAACSIPFSSSGSISISAPRNVGASDDTIRVSLTRNGTAYPLNGNALYIEGPLSSTIQIDNLVPGPDYKIFLSIGKKVGAILQVTSYAVSPEGFTITEGSNTAQSLTLQTAPAYQYLTSSGLAASAVQPRGTNTFALLDGQVLYPSVSTNPVAAGAITLPTATSPPVGTTINSLSAGPMLPTLTTELLWLNTDKGIYTVNGSYTAIMAAPAPAVSLSRGIVLNPTGMTAIYSGGGANVGAIFADTSTGWNTANWASFTQSLGTYPTFQNAAAGITRDLVSDIAVSDTSNYFYYLSTPVGTLIGSMAVKNLISSEALKNDPNQINQYILKVGDDSKNINKVSTSQSRVYLATDSGLYYSSVNANGTPIPATTVPFSNIVPGTSGLKITALSSFYSYTVAVTANNDVLIISDPGTTPTIQSTLSKASGIPLNAKPTLVYDSKYLYLVLAGSNGAIYYPIAPFIIILS